MIATFDWSIAFAAPTADDEAIGKLITRHATNEIGFLIGIAPPLHRSEYGGSTDLEQVARNVRLWANCDIAYAALAIAWKSGRQFHGMSSSQRAAGQPLAIFSMTSAMYACGSTPLSLQVSMTV